MEQRKTDTYIRRTYWSMPEYATEADAGAGEAREDTDGGERAAWCGVESFNDALRLAKYGWQEQMTAALDLAASAVKLAEQEHMVDTFNPVWDVTGAEVDVSRYLQGEPECMIDFPLAKTSKSGRVITLVSSGTFSGSIRPETIIKRGQLIVALALALNTLGHAVEIWADQCSSKSGLNCYQRVLVKSANDELDPAALMFGLAHPAMQRVLGFAVKDNLPGKFRTAFNEAHGRGTPASRPADVVAQFPEGTIFLPEIHSDRDVPDADEFLRQYLGDLGLLAED